MDYYTCKKALDDDITKYGNYLQQSQSHPAVQKFTNQLVKPAPRWPGVLTVVGYQMCGGDDQKMILQAARAMEMCHIYVQLFAAQPLAATLGNHAAQTILANLDVVPLLRSNVVSITNRTLLLTLQNEQDLTTKAHYTAVNPMHVGMVLAGADCHHTDAITPIAQQIGQAICDSKGAAQPHLEQALSALSAPSLPWPANGTQLLRNVISHIQ